MNIKKGIALLLIIVLVVCACAAAFAEYHGVMIWNPVTQRWELQVYDDGPAVAIRYDQDGNNNPYGIPTPPPFPLPF